MQKNVAGQIWTVYAYSRTSGNPITGDAANISATLCLDGVAEAPCSDAHPDEKGHGYYQFLPSQAETNAEHIEIHPISATANVIVIGCPGALWTEPAGQKYPASLVAADVSGELPAVLAAVPPTAQEIREEMDDHSTQLAAIASAVAPDGSSTYTDTIEDPDGDPIDGVSVECYSDSDYTALVQVTETDANGVFVLHLNPATYHFRAIKVGYTFVDWSEVVA